MGPFRGILLLAAVVCPAPPQGRRPARRAIWSPQKYASRCALEEIECLPFRHDEFSSLAHRPMHKFPVHRNLAPEIRFTHPAHKRPPSDRDQPLHSHGSQRPESNATLTSLCHVLCKLDMPTHALLRKRLWTGEQEPPLPLGATLRNADPVDPPAPTK